LKPSETADSAWKGLYRVGGAAALIMAVFIPVQIIIFVVWPPPSTVIGWFTLFQNNRLIGLLDMDLLLIIDQVLMVLVLLALYIALRRASQSFMAIALTAGLVGIAAYFASTAAFEMLSLSDQYAAATTDAQRSILLAAGQVMLATYQGTAFDVGYILEGVALLITAVVMLRSTFFSKKTAYVGILLGVMSLVPPTAGTVGLLFALGSLAPLEIWDILIARRLYQLG
jgi:fumarate reductase subunit D